MLPAGACCTYSESGMSPHLDMVVGVTDTGTVVAVLTGEGREAVLKAPEGLADAIDGLDDNCIPIVTISGAMLRVLAVRVLGRRDERQWLN